MTAIQNGNETATRTKKSSTDLRDLVPKLGLREYWYPTIRDKDVKANKPKYVKLLGDNICLFRGKSGNVVAIQDACPHRGAMLSHGDIAFKGFVTCLYHGFTFDEHGACVAAFGEGPDSHIVGKITAKVYPTVTLKGVVFTWMGHGDPIPLEEGIPEEFFDPEAQVYNWPSVWNTNWRPALENIADAHFRYLHRNSVKVLMLPLPFGYTVVPRPERIGKHRLRPSIREAASITGPSFLRLEGDKREYQEYYPGVEGKWPHHKWRLMWTWMFTWAQKRRLRNPYQLGEEWGPGQHRPGMFRLNYGSHVYTRWAVPKDEDHSLIFYFHTTKPSNWIGRLYEGIHWNLFHNWLQNKNFSEQDGRGAIEAYYDTPEYLSPTDTQTLEWRKFLLEAPELAHAKAEADEASAAMEHMVQVGQEDNGAKVSG